MGHYDDALNAKDFCRAAWEHPLAKEARKELVRRRLQIEDLHKEMQEIEKNLQDNCDHSIVSSANDGHSSFWVCAVCGKDHVGNEGKHIIG